MKRTIPILLALSLPLLLAACATAPTETERPFSGKIAIITNNAFQNEEEYYSAQLMAAKYGEDKIIHKIWPAKFPEEREQMIEIVQRLAEDPEVKALIINQTVPNSLAALDKLQETRSDIFTVLIEPYENVAEITLRADIVLGMDNLTMGPPLAEQAQKLGAKTLVYYSLQRHVEVPVLAGQRDLAKEKCAELGLEFVFSIINEPKGDSSEPSAQQVMLRDIQKMIDKYGPDTAFFFSACGAQEPLIKAVVDYGAIYPQPCCPSPLHGFPRALGLISSEIYESVFEKYGASDTIAKAVSMSTDILREKHMLGRVSTWPVPAQMMNTVAATAYAVKWINGEVPPKGIDLAVLRQCMEDYAGVECFIRNYEDADGVEYPNFLLVREGFLTYE